MIFDVFVVRVLSMKKMYHSFLSRVNLMLVGNIYRCDATVPECIKKRSVMIGQREM